MTNSEITAKTNVKITMRLAFRQEGEFWNAYIAKHNTMDDAIFIGSIILATCKKDPAIKDAFVELMKVVFSNALEEITGEAPEAFEMRTAPESEKSGNA